MAKTILQGTVKGKTETWVERQHQELEFGESVRAVEDRDGLRYVI